MFDQVTDKLLANVSPSYKAIPRLSANFNFATTLSSQEVVMAPFASGLCRLIHLFIDWLLTTTASLHCNSTIAA